MRRTLAGIPAALTIAMLAGGCAVVQPVTPKLDVPATGAATPAQNELLEHWWTAFDDPALSQLVEAALANNLDVRLALSRIDAARSQVLLARSNLSPNVDLRADAGRSRFSGSASPPLPPGTELTSNNFRIAVEMSYELDVWGKYRSGLLAARNDLAAAQYDSQTARITIAAEIASMYFRLRAADAELAVLTDTLQLRDDSLLLQRDRAQGGITGDFEVRQAEAERSSVVADIARAQKAIGLFEGAIATLAGRSPRAVFAPEVARGTVIDAVTEVPTLPSGLPSGLLERRPDIRRTEALLAAAELRIQEARTNYFPSLSLTAAFGSESAALADLFTSPASIWRFGLGLVQPLFGLKAIESQVELATARREQTLLVYQQTVQVAFREVHDALVSNRSARDVLAAETDRRNQIATALELAVLRNNAGRTSFLEVLDAQRTLLSAETLRIGAARDAKLSIVDFAKALGGGWRPEEFLTAR